MGFEELETTLRIRVDRRDADKAFEEVAKDFESRLSSAVSRGMSSVGTHGAGSSTTSTTSHSTTLPAAGGGSGGAAPAPSGGGGAGTTASTSGGRPDSLWSRDEIRKMGRVNRVRPDMREYLSGPGFSEASRALIGGSLGGNMASSAFAAVTTGIGNSVMSAARSRAQEIEDARAMGVPESGLPTMGMLRFAGPVGAAASVVGSFAAQNIGEGLSHQERISRSYGGDARSQALAYTTGAMPNDWTPAEFYRKAAMAENGALDVEQARAARNAYAGIGFRDREPIDYLRMSQTGASVDAIAGFRGAARYQSDSSYMGQRDLAGYIGTGQGFSLEGAGLDAFLQQIASNTRQMAMRGVQIDQASLRGVLDRAVDRGLSPEIAAASANNMQSNVLSLRDQALSPFKAMGDVMVMQQAFAGGGSYEDYVSRLESLSGNPAAILDAVRPGGRLTSAAYGGTGLSNALDQGGGTSRDPKFIDPNMNAGAYKYAEAIAKGDSQRFDAMQSHEAFAGQQAMSAGSDIRAMGWDFINQMKAGFVEMHGVAQSIMDSNASLAEKMGATFSTFQAWMEARMRP